eukprot:Gb_33608 [translate_table: standard]
MKGTKQDEEEFEMLLGEIPRATSAPPHLEELHRVNKSPKVEGNSVLQREDIRKSSISEVYEDFYQSYQGVKNLPASPADNIASHSPSSSSSLTSFYGSLSLDVSGGGGSPQLQENLRSQAHGILRHQSNKEQDEKHSSLSIQQNGVALPTQQQMFSDDQSLANAFANLSFDKDKVMKQAGQSSVGNGDGGFSGRVLEDEQDRSRSAGAYSAFDVMGMSVPGHINHTLNSLNSSATVSSSLNMHGSKYPSYFRNNNGHAREVDKVLQHNAYGGDACGTSVAQPFYDATGRLVDSQCQFPVYSGAVPPAHGMHAYQVRQTSPMSGAEIRSSLLGLQQQYYLDSQSGSYLQPQQCGPSVSALPHVNPMQLTWQQMEEERHSRMHQQYILLQQAQALAGLPNQVGSTNAGNPPNRGTRQQSLHSPMSIFSQLEHPFSNHKKAGTSMTEGDWGAHLVPGMAGASALSYSEFPLQNGIMTQYKGHGFHGSGESCSYSNGQAIATGRLSQSGSFSLKDPRMVAILDQQEKPIFPEKILTRNHSRGVNSLTTINPVPSGGRKKDSLSNGHLSGRTYLNGQSALPSGSFQLDVRVNSRGVSSRSTEFELMPKAVISTQQQQPKYASLEEVEGRIYLIAKDQHGCRFLQRKFDEGSLQEVHKIFMEIIDHIIELMTDPFGNYLVQKLLEVCNEDQRMQILLAVTGKPGELVNISLNMHGTRAVQKLIETLKTPEQISLVISSLEPGVVTLIKDLNGNHVVQRCLQRLSNEDSQFLFDAAAKHCVEIATHRHGCCVLQRCVDYSSGAQQQCLVAEIAANGLVLSQDAFGNYVVQYILDLEIPWATENVIAQLEGNYAHLSMQKFSSNVVEKCLKLSGEENRTTIIRELINSSRLGQLLQDPYANYVVQSALAVSKGSVHAALVEAIRPHLPALRSSPFGKRILSRTNLKK